MSEQIIERTSRIPGDYSSFAPDALKPANTMKVGGYVDEARLIVTVCDKLVGGLKGDAGERMQELLPRDIEGLLKEHGRVEPFLALNLTSGFGLSKLIKNFNTMFRSTKETQPVRFAGRRYWEESNFGLHVLNKRTIDTSSSPIGQLSLRGAVTAIDNKYDEGGLILTSQTNLKQREYTTGTNLINITDWLFLEAKRRLAGLPSLDKDTRTRFSQMPIILTGYAGLVGAVDSNKGHITVGTSSAAADPKVGVRCSLGLTS